MAGKGQPRVRTQWRTATCEVCTEEFKTSRYDTTTCGPTCRSRKSRAEAKRKAERDNLVTALRVWMRFEGVTPTEEDIEALKLIEYMARNTILGLSKQQWLAGMEVK